MMTPPSDRCGRCSHDVNDPTWWCMHCGAALCNPCGDEFGHCGHPKVEELNRTPAEAGDREERERLEAQFARMVRALVVDDRDASRGQTTRLLN